MTLRTQCIFFGAILSACLSSGSGDVDDTGTDSPFRPGFGDADVDTDADADADADTDTDSDIPTDPGVDAQVSGLSWTLHSEVQSLVYVSWTQTNNAKLAVEYSFDSGEWHSTPAETYSAGSNQTLVIGIPFGMNAEWRVVQSGFDPVVGTTITTGTTPSGLPIGTVSSSDPSAWLSTGNYLLTSINQNGGWTQGDLLGVHHRPIGPTGLGAQSP